MELRIRVSTKRPLAKTKKITIWARHYGFWRCHVQPLINRPVSRLRPCDGFHGRRQVVADLQDPSGAYPETTAVTETNDRLYIQSLHAKGLGWMPK